MKFALEATPAPALKPIKKFVFDPEEPLPTSVCDCDDLADKLWDTGDFTSYNIVALHINKLVGWERMITTAGENGAGKSRAKLFIAQPANSKSPGVVELWDAGNRICDIIRATGISGSKIRQILKNAGKFTN